MSWVDMLCGEGAQRDVAVHRADEKSTAGNGDISKGVDGKVVGEGVSDLFSGIIHWR